MAAYDAYLAGGMVDLPLPEDRLQESLDQLPVVLV
jgi:hypothetical protein